MALTKACLYQGLIEKFYLSKKEARDLVDNLFEEIRHTLEAGHTVKISNWGNFTLRDKGERPGRNPRTGEMVPVSARRVVTFKAGHKLKERVEHFDGTPEAEGDNED